MALQSKVKLEDDPSDSVPQSFNQLGIFLLDGSGSMSEDAKGGLKKHQAVNHAVRETFTRFSASSKRRCFAFATVVFGVDAVIQTPITVADAIDDNASYDPLIPPLVDDRGTHIGAGLAKCKGLVDQFFANRISGIPNKVAIVVLSDGQGHDEAHAKSIAAILKSDSDLEIYCCHLQGQNPSIFDVGSAELLKVLANDPVRCYKTVYDAETIRNFFIASISASAGMSKIS